MFEVLVFVYENYYAGEDCPEPAHLQRKLAAVGFDAEEIDDALIWLKGLQLAAQSGVPMADTPASAAPATVWLQQPQLSSVRIYPSCEQNHLGVHCLGFISFLESAGCLPAHMRELVIDRAMAAPGSPVSLEDLKIIILMVFWSLGQEPDALILDELCDHDTQRVAH
jgi:Smg protein